MRILITGGSGFIGRALCEHLGGQDHDLATLGRGLNSDFQWNPSTSLVDSKTLENIEAVIHLAVENVAKGRWNAAKKRRILDSREKGTRLMCEKMAQATVPPKVLLSASAVGFYGSRGDEVLEEANAAGKDFLADVCQKWESACQPLSMPAFEWCSFVSAWCSVRRAGRSRKCGYPSRWDWADGLGTARSG
jgi:NAD dependent epimerase/dehydratase family enzyme